MHLTSGSAPSQIGAADPQRVEDALRVIARRWATWIVQSLPPHDTPTRVCDIANRLPFVADIYGLLDELHTAGLLTRTGDHTAVSYQLTGRGHALAPVHFALAEWSTTHLSPGPMAAAERIENAARRLRPRRSTAVIQAIHMGAMSPGAIAGQADMRPGCVLRRLHRLADDGLTTRTGNYYGAFHFLTDAGQALGPVYTAIEHWGTLDRHGRKPEEPELDR